MNLLKYAQPLVLCTLLLSGCKPESTVVPPPAALPVMARTLALQKITDAIILDGTVAASQQVNLIARVSGNLDAIHFSDGQWVKKGALLFTIERGPYLDQLKLNQARLDQTRSDYERQKQLLKENANSETNVEISLSNLLQAEANFDIAKTNLSYSLQCSACRHRQRLRWQSHRRHSYILGPNIRR